jgi:hypothetical protein
MTALWWIIAVALLLNIVVGLGFLTTRRGGPDSLLGTLLFGTTGVALTLILGKTLKSEGAVDIALVFALLTAVLGATFARRGWLSGGGKEDRAP